MKIDEVASNQEGIAAEEALILRGYVMLRNSIMLISMNAGQPTVGATICLH